MLNQRLDISSSETDLSRLWVTYLPLMMHYYKVLQYLDLLCHWQLGTNLSKASFGEKYSKCNTALGEAHGPSPSFAWKESSSTCLYLTQTDQVLSYRPWGERHKMICIYAAEVSPPWRWWVILPIGNYSMDDIVRAWTSALVPLFLLA